MLISDAIIAHKGVVLLQGNSHQEVPYSNGPVANSTGSPTNLRFLIRAQRLHIDDVQWCILVHKSGDVIVDWEWSCKIVHFCCHDECWCCFKMWHFGFNIIVFCKTVPRSSRSIISQNSFDKSGLEDIVYRSNVFDNPKSSQLSQRLCSTSVEFRQKSMLSKSKLVSYH